MPFPAIYIGDNLLGINNESLRNATTSKARAIFKRVNLVDGDVPLVSCFKVFVSNYLFRFFIYSSIRTDSLSKSL